ncbi:ATP-binding protein [Litoribrevibacter euphylliae]|uniref:histidine kinase n=1 Tax=Litoribrevibacter euphylliae TaxID=1834034 RepID=A0ABV7H6X8_9GAMM
MEISILFNISLWTTVLTALGVAIWLWSRRREDASLPALAGFCLSMAIWCLGHIFALQQQPQFAVPLLLANPLLPTSFLHFVIVWLKDSGVSAFGLERRIPWLYGVALLVTVASVWADGGFLSPWLAFPSFFHLAFAGWLNLAYTVAVGIFAHILLLYGFKRSQGNKRRSIVAIFVVGAWGFLLATSFILPSIPSHFFPYPMLALPSYAVLVAYSVVRYRLVEANRLVSHALQWFVVLLVSMLIMGGVLAVIEPLGLEELSHVPNLQLLVYSTLLLLIAWFSYEPARRFSERLIYPGGKIEDATLNSWVSRLNRVTSWQELATTVETMWYQRSHYKAGVSIVDAEGEPHVETELMPQFTCVKRSQWHCYLNGWEDIPPAKHYMAEILAAMLPSTCASLERSLQLAKVEAQAERERIEQRHLVELGGLTAAIAHELRNPLNIINMASAQTDPLIKSHIQNQVARAELLIRDTLSYASNTELNKAELDVMALIHQVVEQIDALFKVHIRVNGPDRLMGAFDAPRLQQVLINILENSAAFIAQQPDGKILLEVSKSVDELERPVLQLALHNNGPKIPGDMQAHLFEPFISKRSGGSGLGLSIVRRIVDAHQGSIEYREDCGWPVSFIVRLPE